MPQGPFPCQDGLTLRSEVKSDSEGFTRKDAVSSLNDTFDRIAAGLYTLASMLIGEGEESVQLVERTIATADVSSSIDDMQAQNRSQLALCREAIRVLDRRHPGSLAAPVGLERASTCIEDDDLEAAGVSREELSRMIAGPDRNRLRAWLADLPEMLRVIFVLRAVVGLTSSQTASLLGSQEGANAGGWTADSVREVFRQALCSLASQLIHATSAL